MPNWWQKQGLKSPSKSFKPLSTYKWRDINNMTKYKKGNKLLTIDYCEAPESPREWSNLGYFITCESNYKSPDDREDLKKIIEQSQYSASNCAEHIEEIKKEFKAIGEEIKAIYPINRYEHGVVIYSLGEKHGFDHSNCGFYIITKKTQKEIGALKKDFKKIIKQELDCYNKYINGETYHFTLDEKQAPKVCKCCGIDSGSEYKDLDACGGFYSIEDIFSEIGEKMDNWKIVNDN